MDRQYIDDHHIIARYLADQLTDEDRTAFEDYYLEHPDVVRELEAAARFKSGLMRLQERGELTQLLNPTPWYRRPRYAAAAAFVLIGSFTAGMLLHDRRDQHAVMSARAETLYENGSALRVQVTDPILRKRSAFADGTIWLPESAVALELRVLPNAPAPGARYDVSLSNMAADGTTASIGRISSVTADASGYVVFYLNSSALQVGEYELKLNGPANTATGADSFRIAVRLR